MKSDRILQDTWREKLQSVSAGPAWESVSERLTPQGRATWRTWMVNGLVYLAVVVLTAGLFVAAPRESSVARLWVKVLSRTPAPGDEALLQKSIPYMYKRREL